eukprot:5795256-Pyramimonas_sp.AAC.1
MPPGVVRGAALAAQAPTAAPHGRHQHGQEGQQVRGAPERQVEARGPAFTLDSLGWQQGPPGLTK